MKVASWGSNHNYETGTGTQSGPLLVPTNGQLYGDRVEEVAAYYHSNLLRQVDGRVKVIGGNEYGQLGDGTNQDKTEPVDIGLEDIVRVAGGGAHGCALDAYGNLHIWGIGPIGDGRPVGENYGTNKPVMLPYLFRDVATGGPVVFGITPVGEVLGWGANPFGQLGDGTKEDRLTPVHIPITAKEIAVNGISRIAGHTLFLTPRGTVYACGGNSRCESGWPASKPILKPTLVPGIENVSRVYAGLVSSFALTTTGDLYGWGKLPDGTITPVPTFLLSNVTAVAAGTGTVLALVGGQVFGAGNNDSGQLGDGTREDKPAFVEALGLDNVRQVSIGTADNSAHVAAVCVSGAGADVSLTAKSIPGGVEAAWIFPETEKPWVIKYRLVSQPKLEWIPFGKLPATGRSVQITGLVPGKLYEVYVQNNNAGVHIVRAVAGAPS